MAIRRANDGSGMVVVDVTTTDGLNEKLGAILCQNFYQNGEVPNGSWNYNAALTPSTSFFLAKGNVAGQRNYVQSMQVSHTSLDTAVTIKILDLGTTIWQGSLTTAATDCGGTTLNFEPALKSSINQSINVTFSGAAVGTVYVNMQGYTA